AQRLTGIGNGTLHLSIPQEGMLRYGGVLEEGWGAGCGGRRGRDGGLDLVARLSEGLAHLGRGGNGRQAVTDRDGGCIGRPLKVAGQRYGTRRERLEGTSVGELLLCLLISRKRGIAGQDFELVLRRSEEHTSELQSRENLVC